MRLLKCLSDNRQIIVNWFHAAGIPLFLYKGKPVIYEHLADDNETQHDSELKSEDDDEDTQYDSSEDKLDPRCSDLE